MEELKERVAKLESKLEELREEEDVQIGRCDTFVFIFLRSEFEHLIFSLEMRRTSELVDILERIVEIGLRGGWKDVDLNLPSSRLAVLRDPAEAESISAFPPRSDASASVSASGVLASLPNLPETFKDKSPGPPVESLDRKGVSVSDS